MLAASPLLDLTNNLLVEIILVFRPTTEEKPNRTVIMVGIQFEQFFSVSKEAYERGDTSARTNQD